MSKYIKIVGNITEEIKVLNSATNQKKNTNNLKEDNNTYIKILDYWTNLFERYFEIPSKTYDLMGVDLIYNSPLKEEKIYLDIKTQTNIDKTLNIYLREFSSDKLDKRNYIIFNKKDSNTIYGKIFYIDLLFIKLLKKEKTFSNFLKDLEVFEGLTQNFISKDEKLNKTFEKIKQKYDNTKLIVDNTEIFIKFQKARKDNDGNIGNTNFLENIKIEIQM